MLDGGRPATPALGSLHVIFFSLLTLTAAWARASLALFLWHCRQCQPRMDATGDPAGAFFGNVSPDDAVLSHISPADLFHGHISPANLFHSHVSLADAAPGHSNLADAPQLPRAIGALTAAAFAGVALFSASSAFLGASRRRLRASASAASLSAAAAAAAAAIWAGAAHPLRLLPAVANLPVRLCGVWSALPPAALTAVTLVADAARAAAAWATGPRRRTRVLSALACATLAGVALAVALSPALALLLRGCGVALRVAVVVTAAALSEIAQFAATRLLWAPLSVQSLQRAVVALLAVSDGRGMGPSRGDVDHALNDAPRRRATVCDPSLSRSLSIGWLP